MPNFSLPDAVFIAAAEQFPTPFHLYDEAGIRSRIRLLKQAFSWADFQEYYAVKALPNPRILEIFQQEGCGLDCSSEVELLIAERLGFSGDDIMFSANAMPPEEFAHVRKLGGIVNLDDITDIDTLAQHGGIPETICLRYNPGGGFGMGGAIMGQPGESKYGCTREQMTQGLLRLKDMGVRRFGVHSFLASNTTDEGYYPALSRIVFTLGKELEQETGLTFAFANLSGGVGIPYLPEEKEADILQIGENVRIAYEEVLGKDANVAIKTELGRYMTGPFGWLVTRVMHEKHIHKEYLGVDACASCLMRPAMYGAYHHIHFAGRRDETCTHLYDVTGALCENNDKFAIDRMLPEGHIGDLCIIHDTGAHGLAMGYQYNGRLRCAEILYKEDGCCQMIRRAETPEDYFATLV